MARLWACGFDLATVPQPQAVVYARDLGLGQDMGVIQEIEFADGSYFRYQAGSETTPDAFYAEQEKFRNEVEVRAQRAEAALARASAERIRLEGRLGEATAARRGSARREQLATERAERAERSLVAAGYTYQEGAEAWKPPLGGTAVQLIRRLSGKLERALFLLRRLNWHEAAADIKNNVPLRGAVTGPSYDSGVVE